MHRVRVILGVLALAVFSHQSVFAQQASWSVVPTLTPLEVEVDAHGHQALDPVFLAEIDVEPLRERAARPGDEVRVMLPDGLQHYTITRVEEYLPGTVSVAAVTADGEKLALTVGEGSVAGLVTTSADVYYFAMGDAGPTLSLRSPDAEGHFECAIDEVETPPAIPLTERAALGAQLDHVHATTMARAGMEHDAVTLDILVAYTANAANWSAGAHGSIFSTIAQMMNLSQLALDNSDVDITLRLVHVYQTDYDETIPDIPGISASGSHLRRFTAGPHYNPWGSDAAGFMEEVHDLRDEHGADLASLLAEVSGFGGVAWLLGTISGRPELGFSVNRVQQMASGYTFVHEIGHNMGSHHSRNQNSAAAPPRGGIFSYSTGWRFDAPNNPQATSYATVMTYAQTGSPRVAYFSNPNVSFEGVPTGSYSGVGSPADNARSMREVKRVIATYRPTLLEPPVAGVAPGQLSASVQAGGVAQVSLDISNAGLSDLLWQLEFAGPETAAMPASLADGIVATDELTAIAYDHAGISPSHAIANGDEIYSTDFSATDGFPLGWHQQQAEWTARSNSGPFHISNQNPHTGSQHLRLLNPPSSGSAVTVHSPFLGVWPTGGYEFSADVSVSDLSGPGYTISLLDGRDGLLTAGLMYVGNGQIYAFGGFTGAGNPIFTPFDAGFPVGEYQAVTIRIRPYEQEVAYYLDGELALTRPLYGGKTIGQVQLHRAGQASTNVMDIDNVSLRMLYQGFEWLEADVYSGSTPVGETSSVTFTVDATDLDPGEHAARILVQSNDPEQAGIEVPFTVTVGPIDTEPGAGEAHATHLLDTYPNPTRATARIGYQLGEAGHVSVELFNVTGQRVAVLVDEFQTAGRHHATVDASSLASGVYVYRLRAGDTVEVGRLVVLQ